MRKNILFSGALCMLLLAFMSCSNEEEVQNPTDEISRITMTAPDFGYLTTRTDFDINENGAAFKWGENDTVGIFPNEGSQVYFPMTSGAGASSASFTGGGWALKSSASYAAYYPFVGDMYLDKTKIPVSYVGQTQTGNGSTAHLGAYDFMASAATTAENGGVNFIFKHLGCLIQLKIDLLEEVGISNVSIKYGNSSNAMFTTTGHIDLSSETPQINASGDKSSSIDVKLNNLHVKVDETAVIYFMMTPVNMEGKTIDVIVTEDSGFSRTFQVAGKNFVAGKAYSYSIALSKDNIAKVNVTKAGDLMTEVLKYYGSSTQITDLKITGQLNSSDIRNLRILFDNLITLDMSEVNIVTGGTAYYDTYTTVKDEFPAYFMTGSDLTKLESIILPNSVTTIPNYSFVDVFDGGDKPISTYKLTKVVLGENLTTIGIIAFACSMKSIHIPASVTSVGSAAFGYCPNLESITVEDGNSIFKSIDGVLYENIGSTWNPEYMLNVCPPAKRTFEAPKDLNIVLIRTRAFSDCIHLTDIELPEGVEDIGSSAFARCISLEKLSIPSTIDLYSSNCRYVFYDNHAMKELHLNTTTPPSWYINTGTTSKEYLPASCKLYVPYTDGWRNSSTNRSNWTKYFSINYKYN